MIRAIATAVIALGFAGTALADRDHDRHDRDRWERYEQHHDRDRGRDYGRDYGRSHDRNYGYERPRRYYAPAPRYDYRWRSARPHGWYPGWREPYGRGYRYWNDNYYYVVPSSPSIELSFAIPLR